MYSLNKLMITGEINNQTPKVVILDALRSHNFRVDGTEKDEDLIRTLVTSETEITSDVSKIARFVNSDGNWIVATGNLIAAYKHLFEFDPLYFSESESKFGPKTESNPFNLDVTLAYKCCKYYKLNTNKDTSFDQMIKMLKDVGKTATVENMEFIHVQRGRPESFRRIPILTEAHAVYSMAYSYGINILDSKLKKQEYSHMLSQGATNYKPKDKDFADKYKFNPYYYNIFRFWDHRFSFMYSKEDILSFASDEGMDVKNVSQEDAQNFLQLSRLVPNFYHGRLYFSDPISVIGMEPISEMKNIETVSYGIFEDRKSKVYTLEELNGWFSSKQSFLNPESPNERFSEESIRKLKKILSVFENENSIILENTIKNIELLYSKYKVSERNFMQKYAGNEEMIHALTLVLEIGMYMRGWKVSCGKWPLGSEQTGFGNDEYDTVFLNVSNACVAFQEFIEDKEIKEILDLPLLQFNRGTFEKSNVEEQGLTIGQKLDIVSAGESGSIYSCIRLSSNWIVTSAYRYLDLLDSKPDFKIEHLRYIS